MPEPPTGAVSSGVAAVKPPSTIVALKREVYDRYLDVLVHAGFETLARIGVENAAEWNAERPGLAALAQQRADELFDATFRTAKGRARVALLDELSKNVKPQQAAVNLRKRFKSVGRRQAYTAVATEIRDLVNLATLQAWQAVGMTHVRASDGHGGLTGRTDPTCVARNGRVFPIEVALTMTTGHDPTVHPRCTLGWLPVVPKGGLARTLAEPTGTGAAGSIIIPSGINLARLSPRGPESVLGAVSAPNLPEDRWRPNARIRWPKGTPGFDKHGHRIAGEFMRGPSFLNVLRETNRTNPGGLLDVSQLAAGSRHIRAIAVSSPEGSDALLFRILLSTHDDPFDPAGPPPVTVGIAYLDGEAMNTRDFLRALEILDAGGPIRDVANAVERGGAVPSKVLAKDDYRTYAQTINPTNDPMATLFTLPKGGKLRPALDASLEAIDKVHGHDNPAAATVIPIKSMSQLPGGDEGQLRTYAQNGPLDIGIKAANPEPRLTALHEIGHYIDRQVLGRDYFASDPEFVGMDDKTMHRDPTRPEIDPDMEALLAAIRNTHAVETLQDMMDDRVPPVPFEHEGNTYLVRPNRSYAAYNLHPWELFARAYSQWIALRSGDPDTIAEFDTWLPGEGGYHEGRQISQSGYHYPRQWEWYDFAPIADALDNLFDNRGLLRDGARGADPAGIMQRAESRKVEEAKRIAEEARQRREHDAREQAMAEDLLRELGVLPGRLGEGVPAGSVANRLPPSVNPTLIDHVNTWPQTRPWDHSKADFVAGRVPGFTYEGARDRGSGVGPVAAQMKPGSATVTLYDGAFDQDGKPSSMLLYHEAGHNVAHAALQGGLSEGSPAWNALLPWYHPTTGYQGKVNHRWRNPWLNPYGDFPSYSDNPEEILADAFAEMIHGDLERRTTYTPGLDGPPGGDFTPDELAAQQKWRDLYAYVGGVARGMGLPDHQLLNPDGTAVPAVPEGDLSPIPMRATPGPEIVSSPEDVPGDNPFADPASGWSDYYDEGRVVEGLNLRWGDEFTYDGGTTVYRVTTLADVEGVPTHGSPRIRAVAVRNAERDGLKEGDEVTVSLGAKVIRTRGYPSQRTKIGDQTRAVETDTGRYVKLARYQGTSYYRARETYRVDGWRKVEGQTADLQPFTKYRRVLIDRQGNHTDEDMDTVLTYARKPKWAAAAEAEQARRERANTPTDLSQPEYALLHDDPARLEALQGMVVNQGASPADVTDGWRTRRYLEALRLMPVTLLQKLRQDGNVKIWMGAGIEKITDLDEEKHAENEQPRGWPQGSKMWQTGGYYVPYAGKVLVGSRPGGSKNVLLHELGHAVDDKFRLADDDLLRAHHRKLKSGLTPYYSGAAHVGTASDPERAGIEELWAEAFAVYLAAGGDSKVIPPGLRVYGAQPWQTAGFTALLHDADGIGRLDPLFAAYVEDTIRWLSDKPPIERPRDALIEPHIRAAQEHLDAMPVGTRIIIGRTGRNEDYYLRTADGWEYWSRNIDTGAEQKIAERTIPTREIRDWFTQDARKVVHA